MKFISKEFTNILNKYSLGFTLLSNSINPNSSNHDTLQEMCVKNSQEINEIVKYIELQIEQINNILKQLEEEEKNEEEEIESFCGLKLVVDNTNIEGEKTE